MKIILYRNELYDNSKTVRKLPYEGKSWFVIKAVHKKRLIKFLSNKNLKEIHGLDIENFTLLEIDSKKLVNAKALNFKETNQYVLGESKKIPKQIDFNPNVHCNS